MCPLQNSLDACALLASPPCTLLCVLGRFQSETGTAITLFAISISHSRLSFQTGRYSGPINVRLGGRQREDVVKCARERRPSRNRRSSTRRGRLVVVWVLSLLRTCGHLCAAKRRGNWPSNRSRIARGNSERKA